MLANYYQKQFSRCNINKEIEKVCSECGIPKFLHCFYKHKTTKDGFYPKCKQCMSIYMKEYREENKVFLNESKVKNRKAEVKIRPSKADRELEKDYRAALEASKCFQNALRTGRIFRPYYCPQCFKICTPSPWFPDYSKPYTVVWMCNECLENKYEDTGKRNTLYDGELNG